MAFKSFRSKLHFRTDSPKQQPRAKGNSPVDTQLVQPSPRHLLTPEHGETSIRELWHVAYEKLREEDEGLIERYEAKLCGDLSAGLSSTLGLMVGLRDRTQAILQRKMNEINRDIWKLKFGSCEVEIRDLVQPVLGIVDRANEYIKSTVGASPHASIAWVGVSFLLPLFLNPSQQCLSLAKGLEYISSLIIHSWMWEDLYVRRYESGNGQHSSSVLSHAAYKDALEKLYRQILKFQATAYRYYTENAAFRLGLDIIKWNDWDKLLSEIKDRDREFAAIRASWRDLKYDEECSAAATRHQEAICRWQAIGTGISGLREAVQKAQEEKRRDGLLDWLCETDPSEIYNGARDRHESGTCDWLIRDSEEFKTWESSPSSLLWLHGKPGCGKSMLSSSVVKYLEKRHVSDPASAFAYFFFSFSDPDKQKATIMLASLIKQLYASRPDTPQLVRDLGAYRQKGMRPDTETLEDTLMATIRGFSSVSIVIDALDECPTMNQERTRLLNTLHRINAKMPDNLHIFLTSRTELDIVAAMNAILSQSSSSRAAIDLAVDQGGIRHDISLYIDSRFASADYGSWPDNVKDKAKDLLIKRSDGMFQYIVCQFDGLQKLNSVADIDEALEKLPVGLNSTYDRTLQNIDSRFQTQVISLLKWLAVSVRPLRLEELAETCILRPECSVPFDVTRRLFKPEDCLRHISDLTVMFDKNELDFETEDFVRGMTYVRLAHLSVKEYLTSNRILDSPAAGYLFTEFDAHLHIVQSSLACHLYRSIMSEEDFFDLKLQNYITHNWVKHLEMVPREIWPDECVRLAARALAPGSKSLHIMIMANRFRIEYPASNNSYLPIHSLLQRPQCFTARLGLLKLTQMLLCDSHGANKYSGQRDLDVALLDAAYGGTVAVIQLLLDRGARVNAKNDGLGTAIQGAAHRGSTIMRLLLENHADVNAQHGRLRSALQIAVECADLHLVKLLVSYGADANMAPNKGDYPLVVAAYAHHFQNRNAEILEHLLSSGANINSSCGPSGTALHAAASSQYTEPHLRLLLTRGADVNAQGGEYGNPLQSACTTGMKQRVELLLDSGANINAQGGRFGNALQAACYVYRYCEPVPLDDSNVKLLLDRGAKINARGGEFGTALQAACSGPRGHLGLVKLLLEKGAHVGIKGGEYGNALQAACRWGMREIVQLLLDQGADVNAQGGRYGNALQAACWQTEREIIELLLDRGADVNAPGGKLGSALQAAATNRLCEVELLELLLSKGADVNRQGGRYGTALQAACSKGNINAVRVLLGHGAEVNAQGGKWGTALQAACKPRRYNEPSVDIARLLIEHGADIHVGGGVFGSAWHAATSILRWYKRYDMKPLVQLLLNHGANVNDRQGTQHATALQVALETYYEDCGQWDCARVDQNRYLIEHIRFLLDHGADVNIKAGVYGFPLQSACATEHGARRACYLLQNCSNLEINAVGGMFGSALQAAAYSGQTDTIRLLLDKGANPNLGGGKYRSALNAAVFKGFWQIVEILLDHGAKSDRQLLQKPDEEWLARIWGEGLGEAGDEEEGKPAIERYRIFWERQPVSENRI